MAETYAQTAVNNLQKNGYTPLSNSFDISSSWKHIDPRITNMNNEINEILKSNNEQIVVLTNDEFNRMFPPEKNTITHAMTTAYTDGSAIIFMRPQSYYDSPEQASHVYLEEVGHLLGNKQTPITEAQEEQAQKGTLPPLERAVYEASAHIFVKMMEERYGLPYKPTPQQLKDHISLGTPKKELEVKIQGENIFYSTGLGLIDPDLPTDQEMIDYYSAALLDITGQLLNPKSPREAFEAAFKKAIGMSSPLFFDMDGNGIKTTTIENGVYFDHAGDGHAEKSAYVVGSNGMLVWDMNSNGIIDNGSEAFGNFTLLPNGMSAPNGFEALRGHDKNGDGVIDENDEIYRHLRILVGYGANGPDDKGRLLTLAEAGIKSINLDYVNSNYVDENGNQHKQIGSYTRTDGSTASVVDVWFKTDLTDTKDVLNIDISEDVKALVNIAGFGNVFDLHTAMMLDTSGRLQTLVNSLTTKLQQGVAFDSLTDELNALIYEWAGAAGYAANSRGANIDGRMLYALEAFYGQGFLQNGSSKNPGSDAGKELQNAFDVIKNYAFDRLIFVTKIEPWLSNLDVVWNATTQQFEPDVRALLASFKAEFEYNQKDFVRILTLFKAIANDSTEIGKQLNQRVIDLSGVTGDLFGSLLTSTSAELTTIKLQQDANGAWYHAVEKTSGNDIFFGTSANEYFSGGLGSDTYVFAKGHGQDVISDGGSSTDINTIRFIDVNAAEVKFAKEGENLILFGYHGTDQITIEQFFSNRQYYQIQRFEFKDSAFTYNDLLTQGLSLSALTDNGVINGWNGINLIETTTGNHMINTNGANDTIRLGSGDHTVNAGSGNDTIYSGSGTNRLLGGSGSDTYVFAKGHGQDVISDGGSSTDINTIRFIDVNAAEVKFAKEGENLILFGYHGTDQITIEQFFSNRQYYQIQRFEFKDSAFTYNDLVTQGLSLSALTDNGVINGWNGINLIETTTGNHTINTNGANDIIRLGSGDHTVNAGSGNDTIYSGSGTNRLLGGSGSDTYVFAKGHGQDVIYDSDSSGSTDTIRFIDVNAAEVKFAKEGENLILFGYHGTDQITIEKFFSNMQYYQIERFEFKDSTITYNDLVTQGLALSAFTDNGVINGWNGINLIETTTGNHTINTNGANDIIRLGSGDHVVNAGSGNDTIYSGSGTNRLLGGSGSDTYVFSKGHGQDVIYDSDSSGSTDTIRFIDVNAAEVKFAKEGENLILFGYHGADQITIEKFFSNMQYYQIERFEFKDSTITYNDLVTQGLSLSALTDNGVINGWNGINLIETTTGNHTINTNGANDIIRLGSGDHAVNTGSGNDTIYSGSGNNRLLGDSGSDTYLFAKGHGQDVIYDSDSSGSTDTIRFIDVNAAEVKFAKEGENLILFGYHGANQITIEKFFSNKQYYQIEQFEFADSALTYAQLMKTAIPAFTAEDQASLLAAQAELDAARTLSQVMSPASYLMMDEFSTHNASPMGMSALNTVESNQAQADIAKEVQSLINAMASFGTTEGNIQVEDQAYGYLTPITASNY